MIWQMSVYDYLLYLEIINDFETTPKEQEPETEEIATAEQLERFM